MVTSLAFPGAAAAYADSTVKTELRQHGYYYAQSVTSAATLSLNDEPIEVYLRARVGAYWSINSDDRYQGQITDNFSLHDQRIYLRAAGTLRILGGPLRAALAFDQINRDSQLPGSSYSGVERRASLSAGDSLLIPRPSDRRYQRCRIPGQDQAFLPRTPSGFLHSWEVSHALFVGFGPAGRSLRRMRLRFRHLERCGQHDRHRWQQLRPAPAAATPAVATHRHRRQQHDGHRRQQPDRHRRQRNRDRRKPQRLMQRWRPGDRPAGRCLEPDLGDRNRHRGQLHVQLRSTPRSPRAASSPSTAAAPRSPSPSPPP